MSVPNRKLLDKAIADASAKIPDFFRVNLADKLRVRRAVDRRDNYGESVLQNSVSGFRRLQLCREFMGEYARTRAPASQPARDPDEARARDDAELAFALAMLTGSSTKPEASSQAVKKADPPPPAPKAPVKPAVHKHKRVLQPLDAPAKTAKPVEIPKSVSELPAAPKRRKLMVSTEFPDMLLVADLDYAENSGDHCAFRFRTFDCSSAGCKTPLRPIFDVVGHVTIDVEGQHVNLPNVKIAHTTQISNGLSGPIGYQMVIDIGKLATELPLAYSRVRSLIKDTSWDEKLFAK